MNLYLIRHGRQNSVLCNVNVPLDEVGKHQAELTGRRLAHYHIDAIYSSRLIRAVETAQIINQSLGTEHIKKENLKEISFGSLEGLTDDEIQNQFGSFLTKRDQLDYDIPYPGGENGQDVYDRAFPVFKEIIEKDYENVAIITHGGLIRSMLAGILGIDFSKKLLFAKELENCSITHLRYDKEKDRFYLERLNDYAHLEHNDRLLRRSFKKGF